MTQTLTPAAVSELRSLGELDFPGFVKWAERHADTMPVLDVAELRWNLEAGCEVRP